MQLADFMQQHTPGDPRPLRRYRADYYEGPRPAHPIQPPTGFFLVPSLSVDAVQVFASEDHAAILRLCPGAVEILIFADVNDLEAALETLAEVVPGSPVCLLCGTSAESAYHDGIGLCENCIEGPLPYTLAGPIQPEPKTAKQAKTLHRRLSDAVSQATEPGDTICPILANPGFYGVFNPSWKPAPLPDPVAILEGRPRRRRAIKEVRQAA